MAQLHTIKDVIIWLLAILGAWSFFKDCIPPTIRTVRRWYAKRRAKDSIKEAQQEALNLAMSLDKYFELRDPLYRSA
jgi:hypothetical protein